MNTSKINRIFPRILILLSAGLLLRLSLVFLGTLQLDFNTFVAWSDMLVRGGFKHFYYGWSDYLPGYLYFLWILGRVNSLGIIPQEILFKLPAILSDVLTSGLIYLILKKYVKEKYALAFSGIYLFNPAVFANSTLWGQVDSLTALFSLAAIWLAGISPIASSITLALGTSIKPQAAFAAGVVFFLMVKNKWKLKDILVYVIVALFVFVLTFVPFSNGNLVSFIYKRISITLNQYPYTSINAFNFWGFFGFWNNEKLGFLSANIVGIVFTLLIYIYGFLKLKSKNLAEYKLAAVLFLTSFLFFSRMHERHMLFALAPLTVFSAVNPLVLIPLSGLSITYLANLRYSYVWINQNFYQTFSPFLIKIFILANLMFLLIAFREMLKEKATRLSQKLIVSFGKWFKSSKIRVKFAPIDLSNRSARAILVVILTFSLASRLLFLNQPAEEYFDEVYHAFTARIILHGDPKAWEWWNPHPQGFAYEWTHPPLAKLGMVAGMMVFGENSFGWRFPGAILGVGAVFLIYLIAKYLFKDEVIGLLSAGVFALDGLPLVISRIGMNDSYLLFFVLLSYYLYLKDKYFASALSFGLAVSSKWSAIWAIPIFVITHFVLKKKFKISHLWFGLLPPLIYVASYTPMFLTGHGFDIFIGMQKQMWWYHTRLKATHPYTSLWYTWPFLIRPVWLYTSSIGNKVKNIYAMGNPVIFWTGLAAVFGSFYFAYKERIKIVALVIFSYLIFFVPWAASPRIMFFYHYLPSIPFLAIGIAYVLRRNTKWVVPFFALALVAFIYFYPHWTGIAVPKALDTSYYWLNSWR